uniref:Uncharacterized protein n=1 Tax=Oryza sativa subsp. japonica TaxID=39947 RepID=Q650Y3_ORYSJ|nr:hypothetical protein [Oryza sativa Japonica Group]
MRWVGSVGRHRRSETRQSSVKTSEDTSGISGSRKDTLNQMGRSLLIGEPQGGACISDDELRREAWGSSGSTQSYGQRCSRSTTSKTKLKEVVHSGMQSTSSIGRLQRCLGTLNLAQARLGDEELELDVEKR